MTPPPSGSFGEFDLIRRHFARGSAPHPQTVLGVGDDCALLQPSVDTLLAVTADTLVAGVHFFTDVHPHDLGHKSLAVNLSDLAAMGATPAWVTLCLTLPELDQVWLEGFAAGFTQMALAQGVELVGGDTTRGPLSITVQAMGQLPAGSGLRRSGANLGDLVFVTGQVGSAGLGLKTLQGLWDGRDDESVRRLLRPEPRVAAGQELRGRASACIDVSDGLAADLGHVLAASGLGATVEWERLPLSAAVLDYVARTDDWRMPLVAGDDYELCFTAPERERVAIETALASIGCACSVIGRIQREPGLRLSREGRVDAFGPGGYDHFAGR
ncbi:thiamine-phosphate kinase [Methylotetracoccus oryzae]|uniref:thiamine-phosphate kinase n=1 Tax=Methylotetracoccus oryzae TaxID=1919059 RepID=UPI0011195D89|nr:thiamine-phosphate kinase [Methylotetracoccus oryzae]